MKWVNLTGYLSIVAAFAVHFGLHGHSAEPGLTFFLSAFGIIPLAHLMGQATEHLADRTGPTLGGLLNATFGNAAELIIAIIALSKGLNEVVKASLTGSILGNLLLVGGAAMVAGGLKRKTQEFSRASAESGAGLLLIATAALLIPAIFHYTGQNSQDAHLAAREHSLSIGTSVVLMLVYGLGLLFTLKTHAAVFTRGGGVGESDVAPSHRAQAGWSVKKSVGVLVAASAGIGIVAELLVGSADTMAQSFGWSPVFVGVILLAIIGNAAEHSTAVVMAMDDDMETAMAITLQSSLQIALFAVPLVVFLSAGMAWAGIGRAVPLDLVFSPLEVVSVLLAVMIFSMVGGDGRTNWLEGVMLLALYVIMALAFFYLPGAGLPAEMGGTAATTIPAR